MNKRVQKKKQTPVDSLIKAVESVVKKVKTHFDFDKLLKLVDYGLRFYGYCHIPHIADVCSSQAVDLHLIFSFPFWVLLLFRIPQY